MLVVNNGKSTVSSWGLVLKPGERKKIYGLVSRKAIKCSSLSFYPDDADEVGMIKYNYPGRKIIMSSNYNLVDKPVPKLVVKPDSNPPNKLELSIVNDKSEVVLNDKSEEPTNQVVFPELPGPPRSEVKLDQPPPPPTPPPALPKRRGRKPKVTKLITDADLEKARLEAQKLDAKLEAEESALQKTEK